VPALEGYQVMLAERQSRLYAINIIMLLVTFSDGVRL